MGYSKLLQITLLKNQCQQVFGKILSLLFCFAGITLNRAKSPYKPADGVFCGLSSKKRNLSVVVQCFQCH